MDKQQYKKRLVGLLHNPAATQFAILHTAKLAGVRIRAVPAQQVAA